MTLENALLAALNLGTAALVTALALPLLRDRVPPNALWGVRTPASFASPEDWYRINRYGARRLLFWSVVVAAAGLVALVVPLDGRPVLVAALALAPCLYLVACLESLRFARR